MGETNSSRMGWNALFRAFLLLPLAFSLACSGGAEDKKEEWGKSSDGKKKGEVPAEYHRDSLQKRLKELNEEIRSSPKNPDLYFERSGVKKRMGRIDPALDDIGRALRLDSTRSVFHQRKAALHFRQQDVKNAVKEYRKAIALDGENIEALVGLAEIYLATRQYQKAIDYANEALKVDQHHPRPYTIKGLVHQRTGDTAKAISSFQTTVEMDPENHSAFLQLGYLMAAQDRDLAIEYYNSASRIQPKDPRPVYNKGYYLQDQGEYDRAIETYKHLIHEVDSGYVDAYYNIGYIHLVYKDDPRKGLNWFDKALDLAPDYPEALYNRGLCYEKLGKRDSAIMDYRSALNEKEGNYRDAARKLQELGAEYRTSKR